MSAEAERLKRVIEAIEDPCDEGGYDQFCRDRAGVICPEHSECIPPVYPCMPKLRERVAREIIAANDRRRRSQSQGSP